MSVTFAILHLFTIGFVVEATEFSNTIKVMQNTKGLDAQTLRDVMRLLPVKTGTIFDKLTSREPSLYFTESKIDSLNKHIYENSSQKNSSINERSFIYIKQSKKPQWSRLPESQKPKNKVQLPKESIVIENRKIQEIPPKLSNGFVETKIKHIDDDFLFRNLNFSVPKTDNNIFAKTQNNVINTYDKGLRILSNKEFIDGQREYFELLKQPLLRPEFSSNEQLENYLLSFSNLPYFHNINVNPQTNVQQNIASNQKVNATITLKTAVPNNKVSENKMKKDNSLDKFVMDTLEESDSLERKNDVNIINNGFHLCRDCILREKHLMSNRLYLETVCKCGPNLIKKIIAKEINSTKK